MSEFVFLFRSSEADQRAAMGTPERAQRAIQAFTAWMGALEAKGHLKEQGRPLETTGKVVGKRGTHDGPYAETKDLVLGFIIVEARDLAQACALAEGCPFIAGEGVIEVRPVDVVRAGQR